jgi:XTP/dITP diphosphohydrolase
VNTTAIIVATGNHFKIKEIREILAGYPLTVQGMHDIWEQVPVIEENGDTFFENARIKADWVFSKTGTWTLADDSGLCVDALDGAPGVKSARFAGNHGDTKANNARLLTLLKDVPSEQRTARFVCSMVLRVNESLFIKTEGTCEGHIGVSERGTNGFGYDPLFYPVGYENTLAELNSVEKNRISHRGKALRELKEKVHDHFTQ